MEKLGTRASPDPGATDTTTTTMGTGGRGEGRVAGRREPARRPRPTLRGPKWKYYYKDPLWKVKSCFFAPLAISVLYCLHS